MGNGGGGLVGLYPLCLSQWFASRGDEGGGFLCRKAGSTGLLGLVTIDGDGGIHCDREKR